MCVLFFFFKQKTAYEMRISDWSSDVCSSDLLAVIVRQDPMYVTFPVSARELLAVRRTAEASGQDPRAVRVKLRLPDGSIYGETGTIDFVDVQVDQTTDTVILRATLPDRKSQRLNSSHSCASRMPHSA